MGSVQSHQLSSFEVEDASSAGIPSKKVNPNWQLGMPWFGGHSALSPRDFDASEGHKYYGGLMKAEDALHSNTQSASRTSARTRNEKRRGRNHLATFSADDSSIGDFSRSEWTPQDSAYGAACPVCGCIPKPFRRMIEFSMIGVMLLGFVWMVITASIHVANARSKNSTMSNATDVSSYNMISVDDDYYVDIATNDDGAAAVAMDDLYQ